MDTYTCWYQQGVKDGHRDGFSKGFLFGAVTIAAIVLVMKFAGLDKPVFDRDGKVLVKQADRP